MPYRRDQAVQTVFAVAAALCANWAALPAATQEAVRRLIAQHGPDIYDADPLNRPSKMIAFLEAVAALPSLPGPVLDALKAGEGISPGITRVGDEQRDQALAALRSVHDARGYASPDELAEALRRRIAHSYASLDSVARARWEVLDRAYAEGGRADDYLNGLDSLFGDRLPFVREAIEAGKTWAPVTYRGISKPRPQSPFDESSEGQQFFIARPKDPIVGADGGLESVLTVSAAVRRFANVYFPAQVHVAQQAVPLIVHVAQGAAEGTVSVREGSRELALTVGELSVFVHAEDFDVRHGLGGEAHDAPFGAKVAVRASGDSEPVIFFLTPRAAGPKRISIEFYQTRRCVGSLAFGAEVVTNFASEVGRAQMPAVKLSAVTAGAAAPELNLRVIALGDGLSYEYVLTSADGRYDQRKLGRVTLRSDPRAYFRAVADELSSLARISADERTPEETGAASRRLQEIGARLWDERLPFDFKAEYRAGNLDPHKGKGFVITSDEPWIPWEMVRPFERERGRTLYSDPPLCELFRLSRWLSGSGAPDRLTVRRGVVVAPRDNLQSVQEEIDYFRQVDQLAGEWSIPVLTTAEVRREMQAGSAQIFHFSCHGNFQVDDADESRLKLEDGFLMPSNIRFDDRLALWQSAPLVFLNACHAGRVGLTITRLGGWAECFIQAGATAFVCSLWEINDKLAARFAREFYDRLWGLGGHTAQTAGEAFYAARMALKAEDEANPTWLAYVFYGDPNGRIVFGS